MERYAHEVTRRLPGRPRLVRPPQQMGGIAGHLWEQLVLPRLAGSDLVWSPANTGPLLVSRQVVTIHDTFAIDHPGWYHPAFAAWYRVLLPVLVRQCLKVLTISAHTRSRLMKRFGLQAEQVVCIPPGVDLQQFHPASEDQKLEIRRRFNLPERYLLFVGSLEPRKNLPLLIRAWKEARKYSQPTLLVIAGTKGRHFSRKGADEPAPGVRFLGYVEDANLAPLYSAAQALVYPSLDEGFGLPVLEAMACGTPVIASCTGALPEVVGNAGMLIDPGDPHSLSAAVLQVLNNSDLHSDLSQRGLHRAAQYSWDATANAVQRELERL